MAWVPTIARQWKSICSHWSRLSAMQECRLNKRIALWALSKGKVGEMLGKYTYMTMGAIGTALLCGSVYDYIHKKYINCSPIKRVYVPVVLPMCLVICYSMATTVMCMISNVEAPYIAFTFFTFLRSALFTVAVAFVGDAFPVDHFGVMFGFLQMSAGIAGLAQYPLFQWYDAYAGSALHLNIMLLVLHALTIIHPIILYNQGIRNGKSVTN
ncbi:equilibrative nucleobase transporter 1-like isoform X9 [Dreissena polymorpha]|uniref:equilibrative nucleobase transporter 1-like isoform X9 n=1 Tax=Dreissena polymorpha TaxID=45954 RepID=UPI002263B7D8|nr:equilibrative nucleobase transporter 1-like isoform X9 [Dreissena polymorpha]